MCKNCPLKIDIPITKKLDVAICALGPAEKCEMWTMYAEGEL